MGNFIKVKADNGCDVVINIDKIEGIVINKCAVTFSDSDNCIFLEQGSIDALLERIGMKDDF